jgi:activator of HSP90 ATPase
VQAWRAQDWPAGHFSLVTFSLSSAAGGRTKLAFTQVGLPASDAAAKSRGWHTYYWKPLRAYLEK